MKKILLLLAWIGMFQVSFSQVGINTTSPDAQLDIKSSNQTTPSNTDGILIPKIDAFPVTDPTAAQQGMMVYLTTVSSGKQPGFYYWDNPTVSWIGVGADAKGWELLGNSATDSAVNFIGTTDDKDIIFKRNGIRSGLIGTNSTAFGNNALNPASTGLNNLAIGAQTLTENTDGYENVAIGSLTLVKNTTGRYNTALGVDALHYNTSGQQNTALGNGALVFNETGVANVAVGNVSLRSNKTSHYNTGLGWQTLYSNDGGSHNTGVGANAMFHNLTGIWNTSVGVNSMINNKTGSYNVAMGLEALHNNEAGSDNTAIGTGALRANTVSGNVAIGKDSMLSNNSGLYNAAVGTFSLKDNINGSYNSVFGYQALLANTSGSRNTAVGTNAMLENKQGSDNIAVGYSALQKNNDGTPTGGGLNIAVGNNSLQQNTTGSANTAVGHSALFKNTTGTWNVAIGNIALYENTIGFNNTAVGFWALVKNVDGSYNTSLGMNTLYKMQTGNDNTAIGYQSMLNLDNGSNNTGLGAWSMQAQTAGSGNIAIGRNINLASLTASNQLNIGNAIYGADINTTATAKIGIGIVPTERLEVAGKTKTTNLQVTAGAVNGRVLTSDATGNATWQVNSGIDADFYEVGGTTAPDAITDNMYHNGNVCIGLNINDNRYKLYATSVQQTANGIGQSTIYGYRDRDTRNDGTGYGQTGVNSAIKGYNYQGDIYTFGVSGFCYNDFTRTGGIFGAIHDGSYWGSLGYKSSAGTSYGVYASAAGYSTPAAGRMVNPGAQYSIGGGFYGGLVGSWSRGSFFGNMNSGSLFASYNSGDEYTSGKQIELVDTGNSKTAAYTVTSTDIVVYKKGKIALQNGTAHVAFDADYARLLGDAPIVTTTPMGQCNGIYIESVDKTGFTIRELNNGTSNVMILWISVGDRIDANKPALTTILDKDFDANINEVMFNENDLNGKAKAMWSDGSQIQFGKLPEYFKVKTIKKE